MKAIKSGILEQLSVQELIDCAGYNNEGCDGGDICTLLYWISDNNIQIRKEFEYPLHLKTETCKLDRSLPGVQVIDFSCNRFLFSIRKNHPNCNTFFPVISTTKTQFY